MTTDKTLTEEELVKIESALKDAISYMGWHAMPRTNTVVRLPECLAKLREARGIVDKVLQGNYNADPTKE